MYSKYDNSMPQQPKAHLAQSVRRTRTTTKDATGNTVSEAGDDVNKNVGSLSSTQTLSLFHEQFNSSEKKSQELSNELKQSSTGQKDQLLCCEGKDILNRVVATNEECASSQPVYSFSAKTDNQLDSQEKAIQPALQPVCRISGDGDFVSKSVKLCKTGQFGAQSHFHYERPSNIYGAVANGPLSILGSWALQNLSEGSMQSRRDSEVPHDLREVKDSQSCMSNREEMNQSARNGSAKRNASRDESERRSDGGTWLFQASAESFLQIRASHLLKLMLVLLLVIFVCSYAFHSRIRALEDEKKAVLEELGTVKMHVQLLIKKMEDVVSLAIPARSQQKYFAAYETAQRDGNNIRHNAKDSDVNNEISSMPMITEQREQRVKTIVKRSAAASRTTKELLYPSDSMGINGLNNGTTTNSYKMDDWTVSRSKASKGNHKDMNTPSAKKFMRRLFRKEIRKIKNAHRLKTKGLKQKLKQAQQQIFTANLSCCAGYDTSQNSLATAQSASGQILYPAHPSHISFPGHSNSRAVYLQIDGSSVSIKKPRQLIGPWYLPESGNEIDFNDMWYNHLTLDSNGTSIIFQENGLYLISAQVFYQLQHLHNSKPTPMGYRVHLKKSAFKNRRPLTIAECVPSFPSTVYQTCFTQVAWYVEAQDEVYLEHFTDSLPYIEAMSGGQTFLNLVRLN